MCVSSQSPADTALKPQVSSESNSWQPQTIFFFKYLLPRLTMFKIKQKVQEPRDIKMI